MPDLAFFCVVCGRKLHTSAEPAGGVAECPQCLRVVPVPSFGAAVEALGCALPAFPVDILAVELKFRCVQCEAKLAIDVRLQDREVSCPKCQATIRVPRLCAPPWPIGAAALRPAASPLLSLAETEFLSGLSEPVAVAR